MLKYRIMKLYNVKNGTWIRVMGEVTTPPCSPEIQEGQKLFFHHIDGMYSLCTLTEKMDDGGYIHLAAWTEVEIIPN
jgi:hypothetical protein